MSPLETLVGWYNDLPVELRHDLAAAVVMMSPLDLKGESGTLDEGVRTFSDQLLLLADRPMTDVGATLMVTSIIAFWMAKRGNPEEWRSAKEANARMAEESRDEGILSLAETIENVVERMPFRSKQWQRAAESWEALRNGPLSFAEIDSWLLEQLSRRSTLS